MERNGAGRLLRRECFAQARLGVDEVDVIRVAQVALLRVDDNAVRPVNAVHLQTRSGERLGLHVTRGHELLEHSGCIPRRIHRYHDDGKIARIQARL